MKIYATIRLNLFGERIQNSYANIYFVMDQLNWIALFLIILTKGLVCPSTITKEQEQTSSFVCF